MLQAPLIFAERVADEITIHPNPLPIRWEFNGLVAADGHVIHCTFSARIRALSTPTEQRMLAEAMMGNRSRVTVDDVRAHFYNTLRTAAARLIATEPGEEVSAHASPLQDALLTAANTLAFTSGVEILPPFDLTLDSPTLTHARIEARHQQVIDQRTRRHAQIMQAVLSAGDDSSALPPLPDVADEPAYLQHLGAMLDVQAIRHPRATLHAIAGKMLLSFDLAANEITEPRPLALPDIVGAFRSINPIRHHNTNQLLLGGQRGLLLLHPDYPSQAIAYLHPTLASQMGFNAALVHRNHLWATHSQAGLVGWSVDDPRQPVHTIPIADLPAPPRHLTILDDNRILSSVGTSLFTLAPDAAYTKITDLPHPPLAIDCRDSILCILRTDGALEQRDPRSLDLIRTQPPSRDATQGAILHCLHHPLRLLARPTGELHLCGDAPTAIRTFASGHRDLRILRTAPSYVAALSADRTRVILWSIRTTQPLADLHLAGIAQQRIADFAWA